MKSPEEFLKISETPLSIARFYGAIKYNGHLYIYDPVRDALIRADVLKARKKENKKQRMEKQEKLF